MMTEQTILIVEDELKVRTLLRNVMEHEGFSVLEASSAGDLHRLLAAHSINLITLDINLGSDDGLEIAREIRKTSNVPIIMVTGKDDIIDRVVGLEIGADDYITKPFHVREVIARVKGVLRRTTRSSDNTDTALSDVQLPEASTQFSFDGLTAIPDRFELLDRAGQDCNLTSGDFKLLKVFLDRPKRVLSRDQLMDLTGGIEWNPMDRTIDNQIARLRKKIERDASAPKLIKTVRGIGYTFACEVQISQPSVGSSKSV
jgi:DNA-binding response OmpR family regulator